MFQISTWKDSVTMVVLFDTFGYIAADIESGEVIKMTNLNCRLLLYFKDIAVNTTVDSTRHFTGNLWYL